MQFRLLGPLEVVKDDRPLELGGSKQRAVLAHLLLRANSVVPAERLIDAIWEDEPPAAARNVVQTYVSRLRRTLGHERLEGRSAGYVLLADPTEIDAERFRALVAGARRLLPADPVAAIERFREADRLWRGPALDDLADLPSLRVESTHLDELRAVATEERIVAELSLGLNADVVPELEQLTALHPLREALWAHLITAQYRAGRQADALATYRRARSMLVEELGIEPSAELRRLEQQVLRQDPALEHTGRQLRGFQLVEKVGEGAFGVVHRAVQPQVGREVAVKVVRASLANDPEFIRRFEAEAQLVARLEHPYIVPLYDYWREPDGAYLVMRFLRGGSLRERLERGPLPLDAALLVVDQVGAALASAHRQGVVHRDVKPANILLDEEGNAYLSDFGIARDVAAARTPDRAAATTSSAGYVSPEELRGEEPTARADVYSLGRVLEALLGAVLPAGVADVVRRATAPDPDERYADASAMLAELAGVDHAVAVGGGPQRNPYKGLRPFLEPDAFDFHGREGLVGRLVERLRGGHRLVALVGPSGSGKSSVVRAGVVPAVREQSPSWFVAEMVPAPDPFAELAAALTALARTPPPADLARRIEAEPHTLAALVARLMPDDSSELLLVVDQFEELFTTVEDEDRQVAFMAALRAAATTPGSRIRTVLTLRADFLDRPLAQAGFADVLRAGIELVAPMSADDLERAVSGPARQVGVSVEPGLVAELVSDTTGQPGALPLLQFALAELFDRRQDGSLTLAGYRELGGVGAAVARGAEAVYGGLDDEGREAARQLLLRLVDARAGTTGARRTARRGELVSLTRAAGEMERAIDAFAARRLLSFDRDPETREPTVEIAHDALLTAWGRLHDWVAAAHDDLRTQARLAATARDWLESGRDPSYLVRGARLEGLAAWREETALALTPVESELLDASLAERERAATEEAARLARERALERRSLRRLRGLAVVLAGGGVIAAGLSLFAFDQRADAERERRTAEARGLASAAIANLDEDAERSVLLALAAVRHTRAADGTVLPEARDALHRAVRASRITLRVPGLGGALDWSPDGSRFVTEGPEESGVIDIRDARTGRSVRSYRGHEADVNLAVFSPDGSRLASSGDDGTVRVWDAKTGERLHVFSHSREEDQVWGVSFSRDGTRLAASWFGAGTVEVWDLERGRRIQEISPVDPSLATAFSPDGRRLAIASFAGGTVVDVATGRKVFDLPGSAGAVDVDWSPDRRSIAVSSEDGAVRVADAATGRLRFTLTGHRGQIVAADWSPDGRRLATGAADGTAKVWEIGAREAREQLSITAQERGGGLWVAFSPDGEHLMTGDQEITAVKVWDVGRSGDAEWAGVPMDTRELGGVTFTGDGSAVVVGDGRGTLSAWDADSGARAKRYPRAPGPSPVSIAVDSSPTGTVTASAGEVARSYDDGGREIFAVPAAGGAEDVHWSADGSLLAVAGFEGEVRIVDRAGKEVRVIREGIRDDTTVRLSAVRFSPDGRTLAVAGMPTERPQPGLDHVELWDWRRGSVVRTLRADAEGLAFSPDGRRLATVGASGPAQIWDVGSGRVVARLAGHTGAINDVEFAPRGRRVATASTDGTVRLWNPRTGAQDLVLRGHDSIVWDVDFSPDGTRLASASLDGTARVWALDLDDLIRIARRNVTRGLTPSECRQYLPGEACPQ